MVNHAIKLDMAKEIAMIQRKDASAALSYAGWLKHCNSYNFKEKYVV